MARKTIEGDYLVGACHPFRDENGMAATASRRATIKASLITMALLTARTASAATPWRIVTEYPASAMPGEGITYFAAEASRTGALTVQAGYNSPGGLRSSGMVRAVADGTVQAADAFTGGLGGEAALFQLSALPFLTASAADTARLLTAARPAYEAALASRGATLLYASPWPATGLWSRKPLPSPGALSGLRVRTYDGPSTAILRAAGAEPFEMSFSDALPKVRDGGLDAVLSSGDGGAGARLWELLPHFTVLDYASPLSLAFCSTTALQALAEPARAAVLEAGRATEAHQFAAMTTRLAENEARMQANGVMVARTPALRSALVPFAAPVIADWVQRAGPEGAAILTAYRSD